MKNDKDHIYWGIVGCGDVAENKSGPAFQKCRHSSLLAVMRRNSTKAKEFAHRHQVPLWYDDALELLKNDDINAVYIATPPSSHLEFTLKALRAGKHVYLEKPMVLNHREASILTNAERMSKNKVVIAHYRRYLPMYLKVKELIDTKAIGDIKLVDIKFLKSHSKSNDSGWRLDESISGGGFFHDLAPHQIDLLYYFFGKFKSSCGFSANQGNRYGACDTVNGIISFENDIQFRGIWQFDAPLHMEEDNCIIYGSKGTISFPFYGNILNVTMNKSSSSTYKFKNPKHVQQPLIQETINYFLDKRENPCSVYDGTVVAAILDNFTNHMNS